MVCLPFELRNQGLHAGYVCESEPDSNSILKFTVIVLDHCRVPAVGDNTVAFRLLAAGTSTLWISTNVTKDADSDCSGTIAGTLLLFTFTKKASTVVNFDVDNYCIFSLA